MPDYHADDYAEDCAEYRRWFPDSLTLGRAAAELLILGFAILSVVFMIAIFRDRLVEGPTPIVVPWNRG